jgi:hypothetical protein
MPPRRSARVAELRDPSHNALPPLPLELVWLTFSLVPVDQRLLLNAVCRSWRAALREASLWRELDFSPASGVTRRVTREMIYAAVRYARGQLRLLDLRGAMRAEVPFEAILDLARENAATLTTLRVKWSAEEQLGYELLLGVYDVDALLAAAPRLTTLECGVRGLQEQMIPLLLTEPPYAALRMTDAFYEQRWENRNDAVDVQPLLEAVAVHNGLRGLTLFHVPVSSPQLEAIVDVAIRLQLSELALYACSLTPAHLPALTRLLTGCPSLESFCIANFGRPIVTGDGVPAFCAALRASSIKHLSGLRAFGSHCLMASQSWRRS